MEKIHRSYMVNYRHIYKMNRNIGYCCKCCGRWIDSGSNNYIFLFSRSGSAYLSYFLFHYDAFVLEYAKNE